MIRKIGLALALLFSVAGFTRTASAHYPELCQASTYCTNIYGQVYPIACQATSVFPHSPRCSWWVQPGQYVHCEGFVNGYWQPVTVFCQAY